jgi:hypothetical protein
LDGNDDRFTKWRVGIFATVFSAGAHHPPR